jgi:hypothetical protein
MKQLRSYVGQGQVHIVATDQQVIANSQATELKLACFLDHLDQGEVRRATSDIAYEECIVLFQV